MPTWKPIVDNANVSLTLYKNTIILAIYTSFLIHDLSPVCKYINMTGATSGTGTAYPSEAPEFTPGFKWDSC